MEINNRTNLAFGTRVKTVNVLEAAASRCIESDTVSNLRPFIDTFWHTKIKAAGNRGYRYFLKEIAAKITAKYPEIKDAADRILSYLENNPSVSKSDLREFVKPIVEDLGETIDITI